VKMPPGGGRTEAATKDPEASESLLEEVSNTVTSPADSTDDQGHQDGVGHAGQTEDQPLINRNLISKPASSAAGTPIFQPKSFRRQPPQGLPVTPTRSSKPQIPSTTSLELDRPTKIPIMINLDPSERVLLNAGNTVCTSPAQSGSRSTEVNLSKIPAASAPSPSQPEDPASIQVAIPETSLKATENNHKLPNGFGSFKSLCGPNPKKVTIAVVIVLSIWASFILGINIEKKVAHMEDKLASMTQKMLDLQFKYLNLEENSSNEINELNDKIVDLANKYEELQHRMRNRGSKKGRNQKSSNKANTISTTTITTTTTKEVCKGTKGKPCVFPFTFEGKVHNGCIQKWTDVYAWCPTQVDQNGTYVKNSGNWDNCDSNCPDSTEEVDSW